MAGGETPALDLRAAACTGSPRPAADGDPEAAVQGPSHDTAAQTSPREAWTSPRDGEEREAMLPAEWRLVYKGPPSDFRSLLPPLAWVPAYLRALRGRQTEADEEVQGLQSYSLKGDVIAGLTVGFMLVPQCLAFALLAGLPVRAGLYSSFAPLLVYALTGTIRHLQVGPTALMSLLTGQALDIAGWTAPAERIAGAALLALLIGSFSALLGAVRFGFVVDLMSRSVIAAFCTAAGLTIATSQLRDVLGIAVPRYRFWWQTIGHLVTHLGDCDGATVTLALTLLLFLMAAKSWKQAGSEEARSQHLVWRFFPKRKGSLQFRAAKLVADFSSLLSVAAGCIWGYCYRAAGVTSVQAIGRAEAQGFVFLVPGEALATSVPWLNLATSALVMTLVGFMETVAIGGKFAAQNRYVFDANQELTALGLANVVCSFMSGFPVTGSFSRTAVNAMFGATSQVAGALASALVVLAMYLFMPVVEDLPKAALAPLIIQGALGVTDVAAFVHAWHAGKAEFGIMLACFVTSMALSVKEGLGVGFVLSILKTMYEVAMPNLTVCGQMPDSSFRDIRYFPAAKMPSQAVVVRMDAALVFANCSRLKEFAMRAAQVGDSQHLVLDFRAVSGVDIAGAEMLVELAQSLSKRQRSLIIGNLEAPVLRALHGAGAPEAIRAAGGHLCWSMDDALHVASGGDPAGPAATVDDLAARVRLYPLKAAAEAKRDRELGDTVERWPSRRSLKAVAGLPV